MWVRAILGLLVVIPAAGASAEQENAAPWAMVVRPYETDVREAPRLFWIGLKNLTDTPRAICRFGVTYVFDLPNGETLFRSVEEHPAIGSPHACPADAGHLILPGDTHFIKVRITLPADFLRANGVRFEVTADETCVADRDCRTSRIILGE